MSIYRIFNTTDKLGKRDINFKSILKIDYVDGMDRKSLLVKPNEITFLIVPSLPLSLHRMRIKGWVTVDEISKKELKTLIANEKKKLKPQIKKNITKKKATTTTTTKKPRTYTKKVTSKTEK